MAFGLKLLYRFEASAHRFLRKGIAICSDLEFRREPDTGLHFICFHCPVDLWQDQFQAPGSRVGSAFHDRLLRPLGFFMDRVQFLLAPFPIHFIPLERGQQVDATINFVELGPQTGC